MLNSINNIKPSIMMMIFYFERVKLAKGTIIGNIFLKNGPSSASFSFIFVFSSKHYNSYNK